MDLYLKVFVFSLEEFVLENGMILYMKFFGKVAPRQRPAWS